MLSPRQAVHCLLSKVSLLPSLTDLFLKATQSLPDAVAGAVLSVKVLADEAGRCRGVGFVNYRDAQAALEAIQTLNGSRTGDKLLHVSLQTSRMH